MAQHTADVCEFAVLEYDEALAPGNLLECPGGAVAPVGDDVAVGLEDADVVSALLSQVQQLGGGLDVGRQAEVGLLYGHQAQEVGGEGPARGMAGAHAVGGGSHRVGHCEGEVVWRKRRQGWRGVLCVLCVACWICRASGRGSGVGGPNVSWGRVERGRGGVRRRGAAAILSSLAGRYASRRQSQATEPLSTLADGGCSGGP